MTSRIPRNGARLGGATEISSVHTGPSSAVSAHFIDLEPTASPRSEPVQRRTQIAAENECDCVATRRFNPGGGRTDDTMSDEQTKQLTLADCGESHPESDTDDDVEALAKRVDELEDVLESTVDSVSDTVDRVVQIADRYDDTDPEHRPPEHTDVRGIQ